MSSPVTAVRPDAPVSELVHLLLDEHISGVPVVDAVGRAIGVVSKTDVLRAVAGDSPYGTAADLMTPMTLAMPEHASIARAAALMAYERVHRVVIIAPDGGVIGLVSPMDILRWLAQNDGFAVP
ncbi:MAG TPA: CBS domain-containing protein [Polyangiaceae bacterium]